jgi:hypothetical protein
MEFQAGKYDIIVTGAGHAGCEAALAAARMGMNTLVVALNLDAVALMACNPAIGGTSKGHLVREVDALGGEMGINIDKSFIQIRMLNTGKGPAVHSLRAQADKKKYQAEMKFTLENQKNLTLCQGEVEEIRTSGGRVCGVKLATGEVYSCRSVIVASGVYLKSRIIIGEYSVDSGPNGLFPANRLSENLKDLGFRLQRFKTGTPARVNKKSLDFSKMIIQPGDPRVYPFSFLNKPIEREGQQLFVKKYLPVSYRQQLNAKILSGFILGFVSVLIMFLFAVFMFKLPLWLGLLILSAAWLPVLYTSLTGLLIDIYNPKLDWDSEQKAVKQNINVLYNMLAGIIPGALTVIAFSFSPGLPLTFAVLTGTYGLLCYFLGKLLYTKGVKRFIQLEA